jgi:hypothetical protein
MTCPAGTTTSGRTRNAVIIIIVDGNSYSRKMKGGILVRVGSVSGGDNGVGHGTVTTSFGGWIIIIVVVRVQANIVKWIGGMETFHLWRSCGRELGTFQNGRQC